jgi:hypothetical protein
MSNFRQLIAVGMALAAAACSTSQAPPATGSKAPLYDNLGTHHAAITTTSPEAQKYFD